MVQELRGLALDVVFDAKDKQIALTRGYEELIDRQGARVLSDIA